MTAPGRQGLAALVLALLSGCALLKAPAADDRVARTSPDAPALAPPAVPTAAAVSASAPVPMVSGPALPASGPTVAELAAPVPPTPAASGVPPAGVPGPLPQPAATSLPDAAPPAGVPQLIVDAPDKLTKLLMQYLDLSRSIAMPEAGDVADAEWSRLIAATPTEARTLLQTEGYFSPAIRLERDRGPPHVVRLHVDPGEPVRVRRSTLDVQGDLARAAEAGNPRALALQALLQANWPLGPGAHFNNDNWTHAKNQVLSQLRTAGYATASWSGTTAQVDEASGQVRVFAVVDSGPVFRFGQVSVEGMAVHDAERVRELSGLDAGDELTEEALLDYQARLMKTGLYDHVSVTYDFDPAHADAARVLVTVREASLQQATVSLGVSANTGPRTALEYQHRRVFGYALTARGKLEYGRDRQAFGGELSTHTGHNFARHFIGAQVERLLTDNDVVRSNRLRVGRARDSTRDDGVSFVEGETAQECARGIAEEAVHCIDTHALSLNQHWIRRRVDSVVLPTDGYTLSLQGGAGYGGADHRQDGPFARLYARGFLYRPLGGNWYGQARLEWGQVFVSDDVTVPDSQRFRAGGDESVRGYDWRTLSPITALGSNTGGTILATGSVEVARPVSEDLPQVWWAVFVDAGRAVNHYADLDPAVGYGVGVRWRSPVGPLRVDWAWGHETRKSQLLLSVGIVF